MAHPPTLRHVLPEIRAGLAAGVEDLARALLGEPVKATSNRRELSFGSGSGSLKVAISGRKRGLWFDFGGDGKGDMLSLIQHVRGGDFHDAVAFAASWLGIDIGATVAPSDLEVEARREAERADRRQRADVQAAQDAAKRVQAARWRWGQRKPLSSTPGARYLASRGIHEPIEGWPDDVLAWLPATEVRMPAEGDDGAESWVSVPCAGAIMAAATDPYGDVTAVHTIYVDAGGKVIRSPAGRKWKITRGVLAESGAVVRLPGLAKGPLLLAEGVETGLSGWIATGHETWIGLSGLGTHHPPTGRLVVALRDDDAVSSPADKKLTSALAEWRNDGCDVRVGTPWKERRQDRSDFNDTLQAGGIEAVRRRINIAITPGPEEGAPRRLLVGEAREVLGQAIGGFFNAALAWDMPLQRAIKAAKASIAADGLRGRERREALADAMALLKAKAGAPPVHGVKVSVGTGKSEAARQHAARLLGDMRAAGDKRPVVLAVPTHKLADEQAERFMALPEAEAAGLVARVWRGRDRDGMCGNREDVDIAQRAMQNVQTSVCQTTRGGVKVSCPFFESCAYQEQRKAAADLWLVPHELVFARPQSAFADAAMLIVDEDCWSAGLQGHDRGIRVPLDVLDSASSFADEKWPPPALVGIRVKLARILNDQPDGNLSAAALRDGGFAKGDAEMAAGMEWAGRVDADMHPAMTKKERKEAADAAARNRVISRMAMLWRAVAELMKDDGPERSGWAEVATVRSEDDDDRRYIYLRGRRAVHEGWQVPTLHMSATLQPELLRHHWPNIRMTADVAVATPHMRVKQVADRTYSKSHLAGDGAMQRAHAIICREARRYGAGKVLVVAQADTETALHAYGNLPANVETGHHNGVAGVDAWGDVAGLIVVGRTAPRPETVRRIAEALTGHAVENVAPWYPAGDAWHEMADGSFHPTKADRHPDATAEAVRWSIAEGELVQIIGRCRGVNRTEADPVDVLLLVNTPVPVPVGEMLSADDLAPSPADRMLAAGGVAFSNASDAATAYPRLWRTGEAAKKALARWDERLGTFSIREYYMENVPNLRPIGYRKAGSGARQTTAFYDPALVPDPAAWLAQRIGPLAWHDGPEPPPPRPPDPGIPAHPPDPADHPPEPAASAADAIAVPPISQPAIPPPDEEVTTMPETPDTGGDGPVPLLDAVLPVVDWRTNHLVVAGAFRMSGHRHYLVLDGVFDGKWTRTSPDEVPRLLGVANVAQLVERLGIPGGRDLQ